MQNDENTRLYITVVSETAKLCTQVQQQKLVNLPRAESIRKESGRSFCNDVEYVSRCIVNLTHAAQDIFIVFDHLSKKGGERECV